MDPTGIKPCAEQNPPKEVPVDPVIGFLKVKLEENSGKFPDSGLMNNLLEGDHPFMDVSTFDEGRLGVTNRPVHNRGQAHGVGLRNQFKH